MRRLILGGTILVVAVAARVWTAQADEPSFDPSIDTHGVGVRAGGCSLVDDLGSGVIMGNGVVLTSAHVVAGATDVRVVIDGREIPARVDAFDPDADLAVLQAQVTGPPTPIVRAPLDADVVIVAWTPDRGVETHATTLARRLLVTIEDIYIDSVVEREAIELARGVERGTSGAGVFDREGQLVGIVYGSSKERSASFALDAPVLERLIEESDGEPSPHGRCI